MEFARRTGGCLGLVVALATTPALAQQAAADNGGLEEIVVTAQKREEKIGQTPVSITALSQKDLEALAATQLRDFAGTVPGLSFTTTGVGQTQVNLRGVTTGTDVSPTVGIYVDEVPYGSSTGFAAGAQLALDVGLFDVERIEVLRGPQGTLYGASTMGGLLKYVPTKPDTHDFGGTAHVGVSSTEHGGINYDAASAVNMPLFDNAALRLSGFYSQDAGYIDNVELGQDDINQADVYGGRGDFLWDASDRLSVRLGVYAQNIKRDGHIEADFDLATGKPIGGDLEQFVARPQPFDQQFRLASATINYKFDFAELTSVTSYQTSAARSDLDATDLYAPLLNGLFAQLGIPIVLGSISVNSQYDTDKFVQELRLAHTGERLDWLLGAFYTSEDSTLSQRVPGYDVNGALLPVDFGTVDVPSNYDEVAGFATLTYHATSKLDLTAGMRYAHNKQDQEQIASGILIGPKPKRESSEDADTYLANLRYLASDNLMAYVRVATGYRPGGPNLVINDPTTGQPLADPTFASDSLTSYEGGVKVSSSDRRYSLDAAIYQIDWDDMQIVVARNGVGVVGNAGSARSRGAELTLTGRPVDALTLLGSFAYTDAEILEDSPPTDLGAQKGDPLPGTPKFTAAVSGEYSFDIGSRAAALGATYRHVDDRQSAYSQSPNPSFELGAFDTLDLRGRINFGSTAVQLYVKNVTDERAQLAAGTALTALGGPANVSIMQPRTYGVAINVNF
jgi:outer membrane receptor protein involved in Fe transport